MAFEAVIVLTPCRTAKEICKNSDTTAIELEGFLQVLSLWRFEKNEGAEAAINLKVDIERFNLLGSHVGSSTKGVRGSRLRQPLHIDC